MDQAPETPVGRLPQPDKSPRVANLVPHTGAAEISSFNTVSHYLNVTADRLGVPDDLRTVVRTVYREVQVQISATQAFIVLCSLSGSSSTRTRRSGRSRREPPEGAADRRARNAR